MTKRRRNIAALLSASGQVVLDATSRLYVLGDSGEHREARGRERHALGAPAARGEMSEAEEVLSYWFPEDLADADMETLRRHGKRWMAGGPEVDREITERFGELLERARGGELDH